MEDEVIELHLKHTQEAIERIAETTQVGFAEISTRQTASDSRMNVLEKDVSTIANAVENMKSNPVFKYSAAAAGSGGGVMALVYYLTQGGMV